MRWQDLVGPRVFQSVLLLLLLLLLLLVGTSMARCCLDIQLLWLPTTSSKQFDWKFRHSSRYSSDFKLVKSQVFNGRRSLGPVSWRRYSFPACVDQSSSVEAEAHGGDDGLQDSGQEVLAQPLTNNELKSLLGDSERTKLITKLSEANQQNRFLKRQLHVKEEALVNFKSELAVIEHEIQALVGLAEENAKSVVPVGSRKIKGKYIPSHLLSRLEAVHEKLKDQIKDVDAAQSKEVPVSWCGMAENVQVMGSFDGWNQGETLSPHYTGSFTMFSTTLLLRSGRYEIKFLVDGEWKLSPEFPTVGEGLMRNNLLVVQ